MNTFRGTVENDIVVRSSLTGCLSPVPPGRKAPTRFCIMHAMVQVWTGMVQVAPGKKSNDFKCWSKWSKWSKHFYNNAHVRARQIL
jgi:hypothetical protein